ncbi:related to tetratricopeptide repeat domain protein-Neosartorya fischeri [Serendipita indica DSM 11827]|uniref:Related to tetratricopeptide repeat domain protein-Neosartorya fischeri n=1 Tax=Serendipita indica (strain DSM 11827) TaxID=1109443 RepID=G4TAZ1_SERID|nr:related to tetratricopeptide repeat domain protein-Neosartorya fischeri [Serendipita indica DSM 11827]
MLLQARLRLTNLLRPSQSSLQNTEQSTQANPKNHGAVIKTPQSKKCNLGLLEIYSGTDPVADIVAIHGLQGHREKTWTSDDAISWLRDLLPTDIPNARILTYGYDADTRSKECVSTLTMRRHAKALAQALSRERKDAPRRPIVFVAHDLGGIILKWALVICHNQSLTSKGDLRDVLVSTHAILFFGTPHSGLDSTSVLEAINRLASAYMETTDIVLKDLQPNSAELENIQSLYLAASENISSIFFCAEYATSGIGNREDLNVSYHSATIPGDRNATTITLHANHRDLVRFASKEDDNYKTVHHHLKDYVDSASAAVQEKWITEDSCRSAAKREPVSLKLIMPKPCPPVSRSYIERKKIHSFITQKLRPDGSVKHQARCVLYGIGGSGKTQLATNWIREHESSFTRVIFVDASSQPQIEADLEQFARSLGREYSKMTWQDTVAYLDCKEKGWLLFIDNADSSDLNLHPYLPTTAHGSILITTRNTECVGYAPDGAIPVGGLEEKEAVDLLHKIANVSPTSDAGSIEIVRELGLLALAITQAGVYIRKTRRVDTYLESLQKHRDQLLRKQPDIGNEYTYSIYTAFDLSFHGLPAKSQDFLKICAFLHYSLIPIALFRQSMKSGYRTEKNMENSLPPECDQPVISALQKILGRAWDEVEFQEIVDPASRASFVDVSIDGLFYTVHPLLQMYIKDCIGKEESQRYARMTIQLILGAIRPPSDGSNVLHWQLLPHANKIPRSVQLEISSHALNFYWLYHSVGDWAACQELLEPLLSQSQQSYGKTDPLSMWLIGQLGNVLRSSGQLDKAEEVKQEVVALRQYINRNRGQYATVITSDIESIWYKCLQLQEAEQSERALLALRRDIFGQRHPKTLEASYNLSLTLYEFQKIDEAAKLLQETMELRAQVFGKDHPHTLKSKQLLKRIVLKQYLRYLDSPIAYFVCALPFIPIIRWWWRFQASNRERCGRASMFPITCLLCVAWKSSRFGDGS